jgi:hypothetical protein
MKWVYVSSIEMWFENISELIWCLEAKGCAFAGN